MSQVLAIHSAAYAGVARRFSRATALKVVLIFVMAPVEASDLPSPKKDIWKDKETNLWNLSIEFLVPLSKERVFNIISDPDVSTRVFSNFKGYSNMEILDEDKQKGKYLELHLMCFIQCTGAVIHSIEVLPSQKLQISTSNEILKDGVIVMSFQLSFFFACLRASDIAVFIGRYYMHAQALAFNHLYS